MKFEYGEKAVNDRTCVAFIDKQGWLKVKDQHGNHHVWLTPQGEVVHSDTFGSDEHTSAVKKFYPGDKITITF